MSSNLDSNLCNQLSELIEELTTCGTQDLDQERLKRVKKICRSSDIYVEHLYHLLMHQLEKDHSEIRFSALLICDELFRRSHHFRELMVSNFQEFLELTVETDPEQELPPPAAMAKKLKCKALEFIRQWHEVYGNGYKKLTLGYNFLQECKKVDFNNIHALGLAATSKEEEKKRRQELINKEKLQKCLDEMNDLSPEISSCLQQMRECYRLLAPDALQLFADVDFENPQPCCSKSLTQQNLDEETNSANSKLASHDNLDKTNGGILNKQEDEESEDDEDWMRQHGLGNNRYNLDIEVNPVTLRAKVTADNLAIVESLREFHQLVAGKYSQSIAKWIQAIIKGSGPTDQLKKAIDLKNHTEETLKKCKELGIDSKIELSDEEDDEFEEVESKEGYEPIIPQHLRAEYGLDPLPSTANITFEGTPKDWNPRDSGNRNADELQDPTSLVSNAKNLEAILLKNELKSSSQGKGQSTPNGHVNELKSKLAAAAPKLRFDTDLMNWGDKTLVPAVVKMDSLHRFWQPIDSEASQVAKPEEVAALRERVIEFSGQFEPVKWQCRAPLPNGTLCPRKDRVKCPFHGQIIPRNAMGEPTNPEDKKRLEQEREKHERENPEWQDPTFLKELEAATGMDLTIKKKKGKGAAKAKKRKFPGLTDLNANESTARTRLEKKVFNKSTIKRVAGSLDNMDHKKFNDKYGNQWNYSFDA